MNSCYNVLNSPLPPPFPFLTDEPVATNPLPPSSVATFTIQRDAGTFTAVNVSWAVTTANSGIDITPITGVVIFEEGQEIGSFEIQAIPDEVGVALCWLYIIPYHTST